MRIGNLRIRIVQVADGELAKEFIDLHIGNSALVGGVGPFIEEC
jgi:hypothetical protein